jgi:hypothetical protein
MAQKLDPKETVPSGIGRTRILKYDGTGCFAAVTCEEGDYYKKRIS